MSPLLVGLCRALGGFLGIHRNNGGVGAVGGFGQSLVVVVLTSLVRFSYLFSLFFSWGYDVI